jgi:hypothetical protein
MLPAGAALLALSACAAVPAPAPAPAGGPAPATSAPAASAPAHSTPAATEAAETKTSGDDAVSDACPTAKALEKLVELPEDVHFASVECSQGWAGADPEGGGIGDGVYLFHFQKGVGWRYSTEGSGIDCKDLDLEEGPFCISS